jgi:hypothetical protein
MDRFVVEVRESSNVQVVHGGAGVLHVGARTAIIMHGVPRHQKSRDDGPPVLDCA